MLNNESMVWPSYIQRELDAAQAVKDAQAAAQTAPPVVSPGNAGPPTTAEAIVATPTHNERQIWDGLPQSTSTPQTLAQQQGVPEEPVTHSTNALDPSDRKFYVNNPVALAKWDIEYAQQLTQTEADAANPVFDPLNNPADQQTLAERHAPILVLPEGANSNLPASADDFIANSRLREDRFGPDKQHGDNTNGDIDDDFGAADLPELSSDHFLDLDDDQQQQLGRSQDDPAPLYYELEMVDGTPMLTYFFFYAYNDGPSAQNHEGDWESMTLELEPDSFQPVTARYSAHHHRTDADFADVVDDGTQRPIAYVANGSHASFPVGGEYQTEAPVYWGPLNDHTVENPDNLPIRELEDAVIYENWADVIDVTQEDWYPSVGNSGPLWGQNGFTGPTSGVTGPSPEKGYVDKPLWGDD